MKEPAFLRPPPVYIEIGPDRFRALQADHRLELPLERLSNARLSPACREKLANSLRTFLGRRKWQMPPHAFCALGASGLSLRRLALPAAATEELPRLLLLQIEKEFPLPPEELAWGTMPLDEPRNSAVPTRKEILVAALKKDVLEEYLSLLSSAGLQPTFTLAGWARQCLCPPASGHRAILDLAPSHSEWIAFEHNVPVALRILPWGTDHLGTTPDALDRLAESVRRHWGGGTLYLSGVADGRREGVAGLAEHLGQAIECRPLEAGTGPGQCAAILGLKKWVEENGGPPPLTLRIEPKPAEGKLRWSDPALRKPMAVAAILLVALLALPYAQALLLKPFLVKKLAAVQSGQGRLSAIDQELDFLQFLKNNQPPYLEALYLFAKAAPAGTRLDSVTLNRHGAVSLRGSMRNFQQVVEFRTRLIKSGFFSEVSVEEQVPTPDRRKVNVQMIAQWKPAAARALLSLGPSTAEIRQVSTAHPKAAGIGGPIPGPGLGGRSAPGLAQPKHQRQPVPVPVGPKADTAKPKSPPGHALTEPPPASPPTPLNH